MFGLKTQKRSYLYSVNPNGKTLFWLVGLVVIVVVAIALSITPDQPWLNVGGFNQFWGFWVAAKTPDLSTSFLQLTTVSTLQTLAFAICGTVTSLGLGFGFGVVASEVWWQAIAPRWSWWLSRAVRTGLTVPRSLHEALWGLLCVELFGLDSLVGIVAIAIPFGAIAAKVFSELMDEVPRHSFEALRCGGAKPIAAFVYGILPAVSGDLLSYGLYRFDCAIRSAAVLGIIGAGGLGYQIRLSLQSLRYEQLWTLLGALFLLTAMGDFWSAALTRRQTNVVSRSKFRSKIPFNSIGYGAIAAVVITTSFIWVGADYGKLLSPVTYSRLGNLLVAAWPPDWLTLGTAWQEAGEVMLDTMLMSVVAIAIAGLGGVCFAFLGSQKLGQNDTSNFASSILPRARTIAVRGFLLVERAVPEPVWALLCLFVLFPGILPGAIALGIHNMGVLGRLMAEVVDNIDQRPIQALRHTGASATAIFFYGVLPQTLPQFLGYILYRWEVCLRATIVVGLVGAGGLGRIIAEALSSFHYAGLASALIALFALTLAADTLSQVLRRHLQANAAE
ncbi:MAG: PhnE/PtxC family ABC transporter permease [Cyanophyceae cyanobacterium]